MQQIEKKQIRKKMYLEMRFDMCQGKILHIHELQH